MSILRGIIAAVGMRQTTKWQSNEMIHDSVELKPPTIFLPLFCSVQCTNGYWIISALHLPLNFNFTIIIHDVSKPDENLFRTFVFFQLMIFFVLFFSVKWILDIQWARPFSIWISNNCWLDLQANNNAFCVKASLKTCQEQPNKCYFKYCEKRRVFYIIQMPDTFSILSLMFMQNQCENAISSFIRSFDFPQHRLSTAKCVGTTISDTLLSN